MKTQHNTKFSLILAAFLTLSFLAPAAFAQQPQQQNTETMRGNRGQGQMSGAKHRGKMMQELMPPRMLLKHADAIGLTPAQRTEITQIAENTRANTEKLQADLQAETDKLTPLLAEAKPDANAALRQADRVFAAENKLKRARMESMIRTKSVLTPDQISKIDQIRQQRGPKRGNKMMNKGPRNQRQNQAN